jgi:predicted GIY-YIG superfamily endonuclease
MGSANQGALRKAKAKPVTPSAGLARPGYLYRYWSDRGTLLYIGISINAVARLAQHKDQTWFSRIAKVTIERFETYQEAEEAELRAICYEGPIHNVKGPRDAKDLGPALSKLRAQQRRAASMPSLRERRLRDIYEVERWFGTVPKDATFEEFLAHPEWHKPKKGKKS